MYRDFLETPRELWHVEERVTACSFFGTEGICHYFFRSCQLSDYQGIGIIMKISFEIFPILILFGTNIWTSFWKKSSLFQESLQLIAT